MYNCNNHIKHNNIISYLNVNNKTLCNSSHTWEILFDYGFKLINVSTYLQACMILLQDYLWPSEHLTALCFKLDRLVSYKYSVAHMSY